jgi:hypothetical protein
MIKAVIITNFKHKSNGNIFAVNKDLGCEQLCPLSPLPTNEKFCPNCNGTGEL